ncbi:hypothetical protein [Stutzerimonas stutzeri]|uniref:hypothetical protein n=1 Tax=Stutzerimonas stutzeri TaxID=316 RepID=UPI00147FBF85|nr:hypothetical protein [Stutzerimonas stutzeri]WRQ01313.1 hypothetical protein U3Q39_012090 [Stutzerimonas stutzeri]
MTSSRVVILLTLVLLAKAVYASDQPQAPISSKPPQPAEEALEPKHLVTLEGEAQQHNLTAAPTPSLAQSENTELKELTKSLNEIKQTIDAAERSWLTKLTPAFFGFFGVLSGGIISIILHHQRMSHELRERQAKSSFEIRQQLYTYRNKQLNEFYGPLLVLLTQSKELSMQLHSQLHKLDSSRYRVVEETTPEAKSSLYIYDNEIQLGPFRLIEELPYIGVTHSEALPQVKEIIRTGQRMAKLIEEKSGLADPNNVALGSCLGRYLAHLTALKDAYKQANRSNSTPERIHNAVFPREIQSLTRSDYDILRERIREWEQEPARLGAKS